MYRHEYSNLFPPYYHSGQCSNEKSTCVHQQNKVLFHLLYYNKTKAGIVYMIMSDICLSLRNDNIIVFFE